MRETAPAVPPANQYPLEGNESVSVHVFFSESTGTSSGFTDARGAFAEVASSPRFQECTRECDSLSSSFSLGVGSKKPVCPERGFGWG